MRNRGSDYYELINTTRWQKLRKQKLTHDPLCERCKERDVVRAATEVHHITPVEDGLAFADKCRLMYDYYNLQSLCHECHVEEHRRLGGSSKEGSKRRTRQRLEEFIERYFGKEKIFEWGE